ncbi:hypothetical protein IKD49_01920 [Candidatus Saccharibacteria bacterium]|nr:hypothetical protein [Candidatus Saccharibacteria bacterium]
MNVALLDEIRVDFPDFRFVNGKRFSFRPRKTIVLGDSETDKWELQLLHELSHAVLGHFSFTSDVQRLKMESDAWEKAKILAKKYGVEIDEDFIQSELDTYRDWLHKKSRCPKCGLTRFQTPDSQYHCPRCENLI